MKKLLSINLGITSIGYSVLNELDNDKYSLIDYGVNMFDTPYDKDGNSKKLIHSQIKSTKKLYELRKEKQELININKQTTDSLQLIINQLQSDSLEIERISREKYGMTKENEEVFYIKKNQ